MDKTIGQKIRNRRKELKMNQQTLADKSNISRARLSAIENGKFDSVLVSTLTSIATALGCTVEFFLT